jgi:hypothetical protein
MEELSKADKRLCRELLNKGVEKEFAIGLTKFDSIIQAWKEGKLDSREGYHAVFKEVKDFDKHIARRYDNPSNSTLHFTVVALLLDRLISVEDLQGFSEQTKAYFIRHIKND